MPDKPNTNKLRKASSGTPKPGPMPTQHASVPSNPQTPPQEIHKVASMDNYPGGLGGMRTAPMPVVEQSQAAKITPYSRIGSHADAEGWVVKPFPAEVSVFPELSCIGKRR